MKSLGIKTRIAIVITVLILALGVVMVSVFGLNKSTSYKNGWELSVKAENIDTTDNESSIIRQQTDDYLNSIGVKASAVRTYDEGCWYVVSFNSDHKDVIDTATLKANIENKFNETALLSGVEAEVKYNETVKYVYSQKPVGITIAALITLIAVFGYTALTEKSVASAVAVICTAVVSALVFFGAVALFRVPAEPFFMASVSVAALLGAILSFALVNRFKEEIRLTNSKPDFDTVAKDGVKKSLLRICLTTAAVAVLGVILLGFGNGGDLMWAGIELVIAAATAALSTLTYTPIFWKLIKGKTKKNNAPLTEEKSERE